MKTFAKWTRWAAFAAFGAALLSSAVAFTFITSSSTKLPIKWPAGSVPIRIMLGSAKTLSDGTTYDSSAQAAAAAWNAMVGSIQLTTTTASGTATSSNGVNELVFSAKVFGDDFGDNVLAVTTTLANRSANQRTEGDILFNTAYTWDSYRGGTRSGVVDLQRVAIHEMGHLLGLDHPDEASPVQNVSAIMNSRISSLDALTDDDIQGVQCLYGPPGVPANNNFASATVVSLSNGQLTLTGYNTNATKETGEPNHAANSGGRSVWWSWKAPAPGTVTIDTKGSYYDTTLAVYTGTSLSNLTAVASDDDIQDGVVQASTVSFTVVGNTTYSIAVDGFNAGDANGADSGGIKLNFLYTPATGGVPSILTQPTGKTVTQGSSVSFTVTASGSEPLTYQWLFNGAAISGATSATLTLSNVQSSDAGTYAVTVSNAAGSVTSNNVSLNVTVPTTTTTTTPTTSSGGGGGGGAPSEWFLGALAVLALARRFRQRSR